MTIEDINVKELTPMMRHWYEVKKQYPEHLIAYRMGDFYEFFYDDAVKISNLIGITLTKRKLGSSNYPLAGIPHHSVSNHFNNLINQGQTLVLVDQLEDPSTVKGRIVKRGVTRILSPGTVIDFNLLQSNKNNYIASLVRGKLGFGIAFAELSTGEFETRECASSTQDPIEQLLSIISQYDPVEIVLSADLKKDEHFFILLQDLTNAVIKTLDDNIFQHDNARETILRYFHISNLQGFGLADSTLATRAAGGLLAFLKETQRDVLPNIFKINLVRDSANLHLDYITQRNLELTTSLWEKGKDTTLYSIFNMTHTPMGARLLKKIILNPLNDIKEINSKLNIVQKFKEDIFLRSDLREHLKVIGDLERFINRVNYITRTNARDLINIKNSLEIIPTIKLLLGKAGIPEISPFLENIDDFREMRGLIEISIKEEPPITVKEGNIIKDGFNAQVDELRDLLNNGVKYVLKYESELKKRWNLNTGLKISHNNILGYYIQITHNTLKSISNIPEEFVERAHLKNAKRYTTERLKNLEEKIVSAEEKINDLEYEIFCTIRDKVIKETQKILETARNIANIDVLTCFGEISEKYNYCKPKINDDTKIIIKQGRHPVIEQINFEEPFIPNDCYLDTHNEQVLIITGPNMAGKCVNENTLIFTEQGILPINYFKPEKIQEDSFVELELNLLGLGGKVRSSHIYCNGKKPSVKITSKLGYEIEGSLNHPILVRTPNGKEIWKNLSKVNKDEFIIVNCNNGLWGNSTNIKYESPIYEKITNIYPEGVLRYDIPDEMDEDLAYFIGILIGNGTLTYKNSINFTSKDPFLKKEFYRISKKLFNYNAKSKTPGNVEHYISSKYLRDFLFFLGLGYYKAFQKEIPTIILKSPKNIMKAFLQGLFDTDGTSDKKYGNVSFSSSSYKLAHQIHMILLNYGIISSLTTKKTYRKINYNINIYGEDTIKFYDYIGFRLERKSKRKSLISSKRMTNIHSIPHLKIELIKIQKRIVKKSDKIPHYDKLKYNKNIGNIFYIYIPNNRNISYDKLKELINYCEKYSIKCSELQSILKNNYFYDKIRSIELSNAYLYDFSIPINHSFIGNGFINHNSTFLRQVALTCIIAQMGCYVPAKSATIGIIDQIFTRIGASDDLARRLSTFMIEMTETAKILNYATPKSLVIIDELGRGTSTSDGQSIAMATLEKLHDLKTKTLFSTHYHQLTEINLPRIKNFHLDIIENDDGSINFVRKLRTGSTDKSYGIHVAKLAGIPDDVIIRAFEILEQIEEKDPFKITVKKNGAKPSVGNYQDKILNQKKQELTKLSSEISKKKSEIIECERLLNQKEIELKSKENEVQELIKKLTRNIKPSINSQQKNQVEKKKQKKSVQTTFFKPIVKTERLVNDDDIAEVKKSLDKIDINSLTPLDAMKIIINLKEKLKKFTSN